MFFTERLMLRGLDSELDNNIWLQWTNAVPSMNAITLQGAQPWTRERVKEFLESRAKETDGLPFFTICEKPANEGQLPSALGPNDDYFRTADGKARYPAIGNLNLHKLGTGIASFGILLDERHQDSGLGTEVLRWMCEYVFLTLGYHRIELTADATNARALRCYQKVGFVEEGRRRKRFWREGSWRDVIEMAMLEEEWFETRRQRDATQ